VVEYAMKIASFRTFASAIAAATLVLGAAYAQDMPPVADASPAAAPDANAPPPAANAPAEASAQPQNPAAPTLSREQLDQLLAPVALYPDQLLGQVLMASTYPLEVVEAARWIGVPANRALHGDALVNALKGQNWDPSVMALAPFPQVLELMNSKLEWTRQLGEAFIAQQSDVMDSVQRLRHLAMAAGNLKTTPECHCTVSTQGDIITIAAVDSGPVCVPAYNSRVAYGSWPYPAYPPVWFPVPAGYAFLPGFAIGFGPAVDVAFYGPLWGWASIDWGPHRIAVDSARFNVIAPARREFAGGAWRHDPARDGARVALHGHMAVVGSAGGRFAAPAFHGSAAFHDAAVFHGGSAFRAGPAFRGGAAFRAGPAFHGGSASHAGAAFRGGGAFHGGPAFHGGGFHAAAAFHGGGGPAFHGGGAAFHGGGGHPAAFHGGGGHGGGGHGDGGGGHHH
jgi:hypothetical protein